MENQNFKIGDKVIKNTETWISSDFDEWGAGEGIGEVVEVLEILIDIRWEGGRSYATYPEVINYTTILRLKKLKRIIEDER